MGGVAGQRLCQPGAPRRGVLQEALLLDGVDHGARRCAPQSVPSEGTPCAPGRETARYICQETTAGAHAALLFSVK